MSPPTILFNLSPALCCQCSYPTMIFIYQHYSYRLAKTAELEFQNSNHLIVMIGHTTHQLSKNRDTLIRWLFETKIYLTLSVVAACSTPLEGSNRAYQHFLSSCFIGRILLITLLLIISLYCKSACRHFINHQV